MLKSFETSMGGKYFNFFLLGIYYVQTKNSVTAAKKELSLLLCCSWLIVLQNLTLQTDY